MSRGCVKESAIDVVVPSYRRHQDLARCLDALARQEHPAAKVIVAASRDDDATWEVAEQAVGIPVTVVGVDRPGVVALMAAGVAESTATMVAFTDDDAVPHPDWLAGLVRLLSAPGVGGAGGRDVIPHQDDTNDRPVGRVTWFGRVSGNHHLGSGPARPVHVLKGVNVGYRAEALALPGPGLLRGAGMQLHHEYLTGAWATARGWQLVYDPSVMVDHRVRGQVSREDDLNGEAFRSHTYDGAYNRMIGVIALDPRRRVVVVSYAMLVGAREAPGLLRGLVGFLRGERDVVARLRPSLLGQWRGALAAHGFATAMESCTALRRSRGD
jgi:glycosyltransferase involved in cell wall biosynthesis